MATKSSFWLRGKKGRLAGTTVYQSKGRTIQREIVDVANPQTRAQMEQRVKWPNLVNFYKVMRPVLKFGFENKKQTQSDYNALMSVNASRMTVPYITKSQARQGFVVPAPYQVTQGTMGTISKEYYVAEDMFLSTLKVPSTFEIDEVTTIGMLTEALLSTNSQLREGMQLSVVVLGTMSTENVSNAQLAKYEIVLNLTSEELVWDYMPAATVLHTEIPLNNVFAVNGALFASTAVAFILSETISGKTKVSTETLMLDSNSQRIYAAQTSDSALNEAILSYGVSEIAFLNSTEAKKS